MAFSGDLADYPLAELLFYLSANNRSGLLTIQSRTFEIRFAFVQGKLVAASSDDMENRLGQRLVAEGCIEPVHLELALVVQRLQTLDGALGSNLVTLGYVCADDVRRILREQAVDLIFHILTHPPCLFFFDRGLPEVQGVEMDIPLERDILDTIRRADEWLTRQLWMSTVHLNPETSPDMLIGVIMDEWPVIEAVMDGAERLDDVAAATGWSRHRTHESLRRLQSLEVIYIDAATSSRGNSAHQLFAPLIQDDVHAAAQR